MRYTEGDNICGCLIEVKILEREKEREGERERERERERDKDRERQTERGREGDRERQREGDRETERGLGRYEVYHPVTRRISPKGGCSMSKILPYKCLNGPPVKGNCASVNTKPARPPPPRQM